MELWHYILIYLVVYVLGRVVYTKFIKPPKKNLNKK